MWREKTKATTKTTKHPPTHKHKATNQPKQKYDGYVSPVESSNRIQARLKPLYCLRVKGKMGYCSH